MKLLSNEQIKELELKRQIEEQKRQEEEVRLLELEQKRKEEEKRAREEYFKQLREAHEPLISMVESLNENNYLILQYQNPNGRISTYHFKSKDESKLNEFWIGFDSEFNLFVSDGFTKRSIIYNNILGADVLEERLADVVLIGGVAYQRMILEPNQIDINFQEKTVRTYKGEWK